MGEWYDGLWNGWIDWYDVLFLPPTASLDQIKKTFRALAKVTHPDNGGNSHEFDKVTQAYKVLSNPNTRRAFDLERKKHASDMVLIAQFKAQRAEQKRKEDQARSERLYSEIQDKVYADNAAEQRRQYEKEKEDEKIRRTPTGPFGVNPTPAGYWRPSQRWTHSLPQTCRSCAHDAPLQQRLKPNEIGMLSGDYWTILLSAIALQCLDAILTNNAVFALDWGWFVFPVMGLLVLFATRILWWHRLWWRRSYLFELFLIGPLIITLSLLFLNGEWLLAVAIPFVYVAIVRFTQKRTERPPALCRDCRREYSLF